MEGLKIYTQKDFDSFEVVNGYKICPTGDYSQIKNFGKRCNFGKGCSFREGSRFGERCSFGKWCSFGERCSFYAGGSFGKECSFGEWCNFGKRCTVEAGKEMKSFLKFEGFGSERRCTYFFLLVSEKIYVRCGCFAGYIVEFKKKVVETHENNKFAQGYLKICDLVEWQFKTESEVEE